MKKILYICLLPIILFLSCQTAPVETKKPIENKDYLTMATLWYQHSAEMRAIYYQAFNWAHIMLKENLEKDTSSKPKAVVLDIDETLLNNSPYNAHMILENVSYNKDDWKIWTSLAKAEALPGAIDFLNYSKELGVEIFYISNRMIEEKEQTIRNMDSLGFPEIRSNHFFLKSSTSNKTERRDSVMANYSIILFVGDNLGDFNNDYENRTGDFGFENVDSDYASFGTRYIILPNPMYGSWEKYLYDNDTLKGKQRRDMLISY